MRIKRLNSSMNRKRQLAKQQTKMNTRRKDFFIQGIIESLEQDDGSNGSSNDANNENLI
tara:strand:- start:1944 stop:2120 length:177 start_codon:yes stop_codon:yes gene_type:complete